MKLKVFFVLCSFLILFHNCKNEKNASANSNSKDISELTYIEIYHLLYDNNNGGFDAHGDLYGQEAISFLKFEKEVNKCGDVIYLLNTTDQTIDLAVKATFNFPGNPTNEMVRAYTIKPADKISIGYSKLCYANKEYDIKKDIISAGYSR
ncbi:hypothetical protein ATO12_04805 [Aquimarina atlantica]|uniref:Uncharacterized protein n=1 Tax=Aquimarina atlantica TaxID=1317122 RepID=A0A023BPF6_9FLAO|nr:hypothetical protein [Aquimarina atlantica]EZH71942.1 hypothetical protein ATO12_04805 [Aquimarina atlantica]